MFKTVLWSEQQKNKHSVFCLKIHCFGLKCAVKIWHDNIQETLWYSAHSLASLVFSLHLSLFDILLQWTLNTWNFLPGLLLKPWKDKWWINFCIAICNQNKTIIWSCLPSCLWWCQSKRPQSSWRNREGPCGAASWQHSATERWGWPYLFRLYLEQFREPDEPPWENDTKIGILIDNVNLKYGLITHVKLSVM